MKKLAMIGCGGIGSYHLGHFLQFNDIELAGFCDLIKERADSFVERAKSGKAFTYYKDMLDEIKPDMVFICIPPYCHGEIENELIDRDIPFFCEKPVGLDLDMVKKIRDRIEEKKLTTAVGFQCRYSSTNDPARKFTAENEILFVEATRMGGMPGVDWWRQKKLSGGQFVEQTIHNLDIIRYVFGEPVEVFAYGTRGFMKDIPNYDTDDIQAAVAKFENGALGMFATGDYATSGAAFEHKVTFGARGARMDLRILDSVKIYGLTPTEDKNEKGGFLISGDGGMAKVEGGEITFRDEYDAGVMCDRTFIDAVITGDASKIRSPYRDAVRTLSFVLALNKSMETGEKVVIDY